MENDIELVWIASEENTSDLLTKAVRKELFLKHRDSVSGLI